MKASTAPESTEALTSAQAATLPLFLLRTRVGAVAIGPQLWNGVSLPCRNSSVGGTLEGPRVSELSGVCRAGGSVPSGKGARPS
jgi:hypothetical protein